MPPDEEPRSGIDEVDRMILNSIKDLSIRLGKTVAEVSQDTTNQLARMREDIHRVVIGIHRRIVELEIRFDRDGGDRTIRQGELDTVLDSIRQDQRAIRRNQWIRLAIEALLIVAMLAYYLGSR